MISVIEIYDDVRFRVNKENGFVPVNDFNRACWLAQLNFLDWLTGSSSGVELPQPFVTNKNLDWLSPFIKRQLTRLSNGITTRPPDLYLNLQMYKLNGKKTVDCECDSDEFKESIIPNVKIDLLSPAAFDDRANTFIEDLKPSHLKPIAKPFERSIEFFPKDLGAIGIEYIRYPKRSNLIMIHDNVYNDEKPDSVNSENFEWDEYARKHLIWFIVDEIANHTREQALKQFNTATGQATGGAK